MIKLRSAGDKFVRYKMATAPDRCAVYANALITFIVLVIYFSNDLNFCGSKETFFMNSRL